MEISSLIGPDRILADLRASDKESALRELARAAAAVAGMELESVFQALLARERLGSTGIGQGVAIPHARVAGLGAVVCIFARADRAVAFESVDARPVDLFFVLLTPAGEQGDHLAALACVSRRLRDPETARQLRLTKDRARIYDILLGR